MIFSKDELELIRDIAHTASMDCDAAGAEIEDNFTAHWFLQVLSEKFLEISSKADKQITNKEDKT